MAHGDVAPGALPSKPESHSERVQLPPSATWRCRHPPDGPPAPSFRSPRWEGTHRHSLESSGAAVPAGLTATHMHAHIHTCTRRHDTWPRAHTCTHTHTYTHTRGHTHAYTHGGMHTTGSRTWVWAHTPRCVPVLPCTHRHAYTRARVSHAHTRVTCTHSCGQRLPRVRLGGDGSACPAGRYSRQWGLGS